MKKLTIIVTIFGLLGLFSCKKDETKVQLKATPDAPALTGMPATLILEKINAATAIVYTWNAANYGAAVSVKYTLHCMPRKCQINC